MSSGKKPHRGYKGKIFLMAFYFKTSMIRCHPRQPRFRIRLPRVQHIQIVLTAAHFPQVLNAVVGLVTVDVVNLLRRPTALADRPDSMVQKNKNLSLVQTAKHA